MSLKAYEIVAWVLDGDIVCADCMMDEGPDERHFASPVFAGEEFDYYPTCDWCGEVIDEVNAIQE